MRLLAYIFMSLLATAAARTCVVNPEDDFRDSLTTLSSGDTLYMSTGTYTADDTLPLLHVAPAQAGITITTSMEAPAVLDGTGCHRPVLFLEGVEDLPTRVEHIKVTGGSAVSIDWYAGGGAFLSETNAILFDCLFEGNTAVVGGAVAVEAGYSILQHCDFFENTAVSTGGAVNLYAGDVMVLDCRLIDNSSGDDGGGLNSYQSDVTFRNVLLAHNHSGDDGGGMMLFQGTHWMEYLTVDSNYCIDDGSGMLLAYLDGATLSSCIVTSNTGSYGIAGKGSPDVDFLNCCAWNNELANYSGWPDPTGTFGNISTDPLYADYLYNLSQIAAGQSHQSPCVDAGHQTVTESWINGYSTRTDSIPDSLQADIGFHQPDSLQTGPGEEEVQVNSLVLIPNPFQECLFIQAPVTDPQVSVYVYDTTGRLLWVGGGSPIDGVWSGVWVPGDDVGPGLVMILVQAESCNLIGKAIILQ